MAVTGQRQCTSAVTEMYQDAFVGSSIANGTTIMPFDLRQHNFPQELGTQARRWWRTESSHVDVHARSTFHHPMMSRCIVAQGSSLDDQPQRRDFTPEIPGVSTSQPMSHSVIRFAGSLAVVCGVSLRHSALLSAVLFLMPMTTSSMTRWMDDLGSNVPTPEQRLQHLRALTPATACPRDGDDPMGTDHGVMVVKDEQDRMLIPHEVASENGADARQCLQRVKDLGRHGTAAFSDDSHSLTAAITAVFPQARFQADHCHTVKHIWGHLTKSRVSSRRHMQAHGEEKNDEQFMERAKTLWKLRWSLLKKPANGSVEEKQAIAELAREDEGFVPRFRSRIRQLVTLCDHAHSEAQAKRRLPQRSKALQAVQDQPLDKIVHFFDDHWDQALRSLRKKGMGTHRRGSNSESGMRLLRRLEKNHDGIRSATTRQHSMQISQAIKYLSLDIADFIKKGPQMPGLPRV